MNDFQVMALLGAIVTAIVFLIVVVVYNFIFMLKLAAVITFIGIVVLGIYAVFAGIGYIVHLLINLFSRKGK
ncbi:putative membrane protein [Bacillus phage vB_BceM_Bc431v3]|uniref:Putative membrane protein n=1 Tax=Bacillus phage vB_BceM_Bc431v3 TaxID=1195072 RepID=M4HPV6_9CAUD|nr:membrane protein [Bacillus phage vB_BceM_Bc431v3]AFQ96370.1 putative membrane protein [Bacillus phage vB_BceM_Bc431v3]